LFSGTFAARTGCPVPHIVDPSGGGTFPAGREHGGNGFRFPRGMSVAGRAALGAALAVRINAFALAKRALPGAIVRRSGGFVSPGSRDLNPNFIIGHLSLLDYLGSFAVGFVTHKSISTGV
jgi:hypothetical protein